MMNNLTRRPAAGIASARVRKTETFQLAYIRATIPPYANVVVASCPTLRASDGA